MRKPKRAKGMERKVLDVVLIELRRAQRLKRQLTIVIDPWLAGVGTNIFASPNESGRSYEITERRSRRRKHGT